MSEVKKTESWWDTLTEREVEIWIKSSLKSINDSSREFVRNYLKNTFGKISFKILDMGCGIGTEYAGYFHYDLIKTMQYIGIDNSEKWLSYCKEKYPKVEFIKDDINSTSLESNYFDVILCRHVLEHQSYYHNIVNEAFRLSKNIIIFIFFIHLSDSDDKIENINSINGIKIPNNTYNKNKFYDFIRKFNPEIINDCILEGGNQIIIMKKNTL